MTVCRNPTLCFTFNWEMKMRFSTSFNLCLDFQHNAKSQSDFYQLLYSLNPSSPRGASLKKWFHCPLIHYVQQRCQLSCKWLKTQLLGNGKRGAKFNSSKMEKRWSQKKKKAVKTIWQIRHALQCGTELLIWELGLLNLSFHYSYRDPKDIHSLQFRSESGLLF